MAKLKSDVTNTYLEKNNNLERLKEIRDYVRRMVRIDTCYGVYLLLYDEEENIPKSLEEIQIVRKQLENNYKKDDAFDKQIFEGYKIILHYSEEDYRINEYNNEKLMLKLKKNSEYRAVSHLNAKNSTVL